MSEVMSLRELFIGNLRRAYDAERRLVKSLPDLYTAASSDELKHALQTHLEETKGHVDRLVQIFGWFDVKPKPLTSQGIKGILGDGKTALSVVGEPDVKDAAIIGTAQEAEHFEIALYGTLRTWAIVLGRKEAMEALEVTLEEEKAADGILTNIASLLNTRAAHAG